MGRLAVVAPPLFLFLAGLATAAVSPFAWGAGEHAGLPAWMTTFAGVIFAGPAVIMGFLVLKETLTRTAAGFSAFVPQLLLGIFMFWLMAIAEVVLAARLADPSTYNSLLNEAGRPETTPAGFLAVTMLVTGFFGGWTGMGAYLYGQGFLNLRAFRFDRQLDEPDLMDDWLTGRNPRW
jgi:hypothetical protein